MRRCWLLAEAVAEIDEGVDFYLAEADFDPRAALRFEAALGAAISDIRESPTRWPSQTTSETRGVISSPAPFRTGP